MKTSRILLTLSIFTVGVVVTYMILRSFQSELTNLSLMMGAIVGTQSSVIMHHRQPGATLTFQFKLRLGVILALAGLMLSLIMQAMFHWFPFPEVSIPIGTVSCFMVPFVLSGFLWQAFEKDKNNG